MESTTKYQDLKKEVIEDLNKILLKLKDLEYLPSKDNSYDEVSANRNLHNLIDSVNTLVESEDGSFSDYYSSNVNC